MNKEENKELKRLENKIAKLETQLEIEKQKNKLSELQIDLDRKERRNLYLGNICAIENEVKQIENILEMFKLVI